MQSIFVNFKLLKNSISYTVSVANKLNHIAMKSVIHIGGKGSRDDHKLKSNKVSNLQKIL